MRGDQHAFLNTFNSKISQNFRELKLSREGAKPQSRLKHFGFYCALV
jgi:hypothetical protein